MRPICDRFRTQRIASLPPSRRAVRLLVCGVCAACHRVADNAPTSLTLAHRHVSRCARPLDNRKIAFGSGRLAIRASASRPLGWAGALSATVGTSASCGSRRRSARGPRDSSALVCAIHPRLRLRGAWSEYLPSRRASAIAASCASRRLRLLRLVPPPPRLASRQASTRAPIERKAHGWRRSRGASGNACADILRMMRRRKRSFRREAAQGA